MRKLSVHLDDDLFRKVREAAGPNGISSWLREAAARRLRAETLLAVSEEIAEATGGPYTYDELSAARRSLVSGGY